MTHHKQPSSESTVEVGGKDPLPERNSHNAVSPPAVDFEAVARMGAEAAEDKKASHVLVLNLGDFSSITDYFVLASGKTRLQTRAIANAIDENLKSVPIRRRRQGYRAGGWILLDYGGVVFHVFLERERDYYDLEGLWSTAPIVYRSGA